MQLQSAIKSYQMTEAELAMRWFTWHEAQASDHTLSAKYDLGDKAFHLEQARFHAGLARTWLNVYRRVKGLY